MLLDFLVLKVQQFTFRVQKSDLGNVWLTRWNLAGTKMIEVVLKTVRFHGFFKPLAADLSKVLFRVLFSSKNDALDVSKSD